MNRLVALCLALLLAGTAQAAADVEPNDSILGAEGPLTGAQPYEGTIGTPNDVDFYYLHAQSQQQVEFQLIRPEAGTCGVEYRLAANGNSDTLFEGYMRYRLGEATWTPVDVRYTTPQGENLLLLEISSQCEDSPSGFVPFRYIATIGPAGALVSGQPLTLPAGPPVTEPNETSSQAFGPLVGGIRYDVNQDTSNDEDWLYFNTALGRQSIDVEVINGSSCSFSADLYRDEGREAPLMGLSKRIGGDTATGQRAFHIPLVSTRSQRFNLRVSGCPAVVQIRPAIALVPKVVAAQPQTRTEACRTGIRRRDAARRNLVRARARVKSARTKSQRARAQRRVRLAERKYKRYRKQVRQLC